MDIVLETLDFSDKFILPASSKNVGYVSMNAEIQFCDNGSFELVFVHPEMEQFVKAHPEGLFVLWGKFQGYMTDFQFTKNEKRIFGSHLNVMLHKAVFPPQTITQASGDVRTVLYNLIGRYIPWLHVEPSTEPFGTVTYETDTYKAADSVIQEMLSKIQLGFTVYLEDRTLYFGIRRPKHNPIVLSENNRNITDFQEDFSNKTVAFGGWYQKTKEDSGTEVDPPVWTYLTSADKAGIFKQDVVLSAESPTAAADELAGYVAEHTFDCKTRNLDFGTDYGLGDVLRFQTGSSMAHKQVSGVSLWLEGSTYHEEPTLTNWEE